MKKCTAIAKYRMGQKLTQEQLAQNLGVDRTTVSKWEVGVACPRVDKLLQLSKILNCTVDELLTNCQASA